MIKLKSYFKIYVELNIKFFLYVIGTLWPFIIYIFVSIYGFYGPALEGGNTLRSIYLGITLYMMVTSVLVCLAYAIPASRPILVDLVGENLIIKSMQPLISNKLFIIGLVCLAGIMLVEIDTQVISNAILQTEIASHTKSYEALYGVDPLQ